MFRFKLISAGLAMCLAFLMTATVSSQEEGTAPTPIIGNLPETETNFRDVGPGTGIDMISHGWTMGSQAMTLVSVDMNLCFNFGGGGSGIYEIRKGATPSVAVTETFLAFPGPQTGAGVFTLTAVNPFIMHPGETYWLTLSAPFSNPIGWGLNLDTNPVPMGDFATSEGFRFNDGDFVGTENLLHQINGTPVQPEVVIGNLPETENAFRVVGPGTGIDMISHGWTMGSQAMTLESVDMNLCFNFGGGGSGIYEIRRGATPSVAITETFLAFPGSQTGAGVFTLTAVNPFIMHPGETYWLTLSAPFSNPIGWGLNLDTNPVPMGDFATSEGFRFNDGDFVGTENLLHQITATPIGCLPVPPTNDDFADTLTVEFPLNETGTNANATLEVTAGEPESADTGATVWWSFTAPSDGTVTIDTFGSDFDTQLHIFQGTNFASMSLVTSNNDAGGSAQSEVTFEVTEGSLYEIRVGGFDPDGPAQTSTPAAQGNIVLNGTFEAGLLLGDVNCDGAVNLLDVEPFIEFISTGEFEPKADVNQDNVVNLLDVGPFIDLLNGG